MLLAAEGTVAGIVSGGCLETDLEQRATEVLRAGAARTLVYDMRSPDDVVWGLGLGCNGEIRVLLERIDPGETPAYLSFIARCRDERRCGVVATVFGGESDRAPAVGSRMLVAFDGTVREAFADGDLARRVERDVRAVLDARRSTTRRYRLAGGYAEVFLECIEPAARLLIFGAGADAEPLVRFAAELGWVVDVFDHRAAYVRPERFPAARAVHELSGDPGDWPEVDARTAVVVMTHQFLRDREILSRMLRPDAAYVGVLGPRRRALNLIERLRESDAAFDAAAPERLYGPVGLDIGAETPEEIALAALAEIQAVFAARRGGFLRERDAPLHDPPTEAP